MKLKISHQKIKPCPFCGRKYEDIDQVVKGKGKAIRFECIRCGAAGPFPNCEMNYVRGKPQEYYDALSIEAWNRRKKNET